MRFFKRKQSKSVVSVFEQEGYDAAVTYASELVLKTIPDRAVAYHFVAQQIEAASRGDQEAAIFASKSGITPTDYDGSSLINLPGVAGPTGPLAQMLRILLEGKGGYTAGKELRWDIVDSVMRKYEIGKYCKPSSDPRLVHLVESIEKLDSGAFVAINNDLGFFTEANPKLPDITRMAYMYARRIAVAGMYLQGHVDKDLVVYVKDLFLALGHSTDGSEVFQTEAIIQARELINSYLPMLTPLVMKKMTDLAENPDTEIDSSSRTLSDVEVILELEKANPFVHEDEIAEEETLSNVVQQVANTDWGAFRNLLEDISNAGLILISDPLLSAAAGYAMELAVAGLFVSGLVNYQMIDDKRDGILLFKADIGDDKELHLLAVRQALCLAQLYIPNINEDHVASIIQTANLKLSLRENGEPPLNPTEVLSRLETLLLENTAEEPVEISKELRFETFQQAAEWARRESGRVITPSKDGSCYIALSHGRSG